VITVLLHEGLEVIVLPYFSPALLGATDAIEGGKQVVSVGGIVHADLLPG
jgi:hypothetical protein